MRYVNQFDVHLYDTWNEDKKSIVITEYRPFFDEGEIWWCVTGLNIGSELNGKGEHFLRPVLIIKKLTPDSCIVIPITMKKKEGTWFTHITVNGRDRWAVLHQIRMVSTKRFQDLMAVLCPEDFAKVKEKLKRLLELP